MGSKKNLSGIPQISPREAGEMGNVLIVDVREPEEWARVHLPRSRHIPLGELPLRYAELPKGKTLLLLCHHGMRSQRAAAYLRDKGYPVANIEGGIDRWAVEVDPDMPRY